MKGVDLGTLLLIVVLVAPPLAVASMVSGMGGPWAPAPRNSTSSASPSTSPIISQLGNSNASLVLIIAVVPLELPILLRSRRNMLWELLMVAGSVVAAVLLRESVASS